MMPKLAIATFVLAAAMGCQANVADRMHIAEQQVSVHEMKDFTLRDERGATLLAKTNAEHSTILIRRVHLGERHDRSTHTVTSATLNSLRGLPGAKAVKQREVRHARYGGAQFDVRFEPPTQEGRTYERHHVLLFGEKHAYHLVHTAPEGHLVDIASEFTTMVDSLVEEPQS